MTNQPTPTLTYIGTYTSTVGDAKGKADGIYTTRLDQGNGAVTQPHVTAKIDDPSFLVIEPQGRYLYAVEELSNGGHVAAFAIDQTTGALSLLNRQPSHGADPAHISVDRTGRWIMVANYTSGSIAVYPINGDGTLGDATSIIQHEGKSIDPSRQAGPHAHFILSDPANHFVLVADLGMDKIMVYRLDTTKGTLTPNDPPFAAMEPGSGPRHFVFHPNGRYVFVINELNSSVTACTYDADHGVLTPIQHLSTLPADFDGNNSCAAIQIAPSGRFLYGSNRGHNSIALFAVDDATGQLTSNGYVSTGGENPRDFALEPQGTLLLAANQDSDTVVIFRVDAATGGLSTTGDVLNIPTPVCITFCPEAG